MFYRRIYYDKATGEILDSRMAAGDVKVLTQEAEFALFHALQGRPPETVGVLEWMEPDAAAEAQFAAQMLASVDVSADPPAMVFGPFPKPEPDELEQALEILGVEVNEDEA